MYLQSRVVRAALCASLSLPSLLLAGCSSAGTVGAASATGVPALVTGNWQFSSSAAAAARIPALSGELSGNSSAIAGILHAQGSSSCVSPASSFVVSGAAKEDGSVTLTGPVAGGTLAITGTLAADGKSLSDASYAVTGGTCSFAKPATAAAQSFSPVTGTYAGTLAGSSGSALAVTATLAQAPLSDVNGNFTLNGTGNFGTTPCFTSPVPIVNTQVTGGTFTMTYADSVTGNAALVSGTFSTDATTLTVTWSLSGACGPDSGTGVLTRQ